MSGIGAFRTLGRRLSALLVGLVLGLLPATALAVHGSRDLGRPADWQPGMLLTLLATLGIVVLATLGSLYLRHRGIEWEFQRPDADTEHQ